MYKRSWAKNNIVIILLLLFFVGCARQPKLTIVTKGNSKLPTQIVQKLSSVKNVKTLKAYAKAELCIKGRKRTFDVAIVASLPNMLRLDLLDPLAGPIASIIVAPEETIYTDSSGTNSCQGAEADAAFKKFTKLPWSVSEVIDIFTGRLPVQVDLTNEYPLDQAGRYWIIKDQSAINLNDKGIVYSELSKLSPFVTIEYSDHVKVGKIDFPKRININLARSKTSFIIEYKDVELNREVEPGIFR